MSFLLTANELANQFPALEFDAASHTYTHAGRTLVSVTTYLKRFSEYFDAQAAAARMAAKPGATQSAAQLLAMWAAKAEASCALGTAVHEFVEHWWKAHAAQGMEVRRESLCDNVPQPHAAPIDGFLRLYYERLHKLTPLALEQRVYDVRLGVAGTIDALLYDAHGGLWVFDWKTNGRFRTDAQDTYGRCLLPPFGDLPDNELTKYSVQVSLYRLILERAGISTSGGVLVHLPVTGAARLHPAYDLRQRLAHHFQVAP